MNRTSLSILVEFTLNNMSLWIVLTSLRKNQSNIIRNFVDLNMNRHISLLLFIGLILGQDHFNVSWILADNDILKISPRKTIAQTLTIGKLNNL